MSLLDLQEVTKIYGESPTQVPAIADVSLSVDPGTFAAMGPSGSGKSTLLTSGVASEFHLGIGDTWRVGGVDRRVVGTVENPQNLLDEFALVAPGQVTHATQVTALFDAPGVASSSIGYDAETPASVARSNPFNPETISLAALLLGMVLIALVAVGGSPAQLAQSSRTIARDLGAQLIPLETPDAVDVLFILVGMPAVAAAVGWLFAGRQPVTIARHPIA